VVYQIEFWPEVETHLDALTAAERRVVFDGIEVQLRHQPTVETRNRKSMRASPFAPWELRIGHLRVYYDVEETPVPAVVIRAVGVKQGNEVWIGGRRFKL
jgi:mRNA-degrading endonuclease RelE of RelBE toxin-antitoxin system